MRYRIKKKSWTLSPLGPYYGTYVEFHVQAKFFFWRTIKIYGDNRDRGLALATDLLNTLKGPEKSPPDQTIWY